MRLTIPAVPESICLRRFSVFFLFLFCLAVMANPLTFEQAANGDLRIHYTTSGITRTTIPDGDRTWTAISLEDAITLGEPGEPALPVQAKLVRISDRGNVELRIGKVRYHDIGEINVLPVQSADNRETGNRLEYNEVVYSRTDWQPNIVATISTPVIVRDARVVALQIRPVQANPATKTLRVYDEIELEILTTGAVGENERTGSHKPVPSFAAIYRDMIGAEDLADECDDAPPGQILLVLRSNASFQSVIQRWVDWKIKSGHPVQLLFTTATTFPQLYNDIHAAYLSANPPLECIQLVGDAENSGMNLPTNVNNGFDHMLLCHTGNDMIPDIPVSRFSIDNLTHLQTMVNRTINYECTPLMTDTLWFNRGIATADITQNYLTQNRDVARFALDMMDARGITDTIYQEYSGGTVEPVLNPGAAFWAYCGFSATMFPMQLITGIQNTNKPFVSIITSMGAGNFAGAGVGGLTEQLTRLGTPAQPRGSIASVATATSGTHAQWLLVINAGFTYGFGVLQQRTPGELLLTTKLQIWRNAVDESYNTAINYMSWTNMMGDGTVPIWTGVPRTITANIPDTIPLGQNSLFLTVMRSNVPEPGARVTLSRRDTALAVVSSAITDANGRVMLPTGSSIPGDLYVTVTGNRPGQNLYPIIDTIRVVSQRADVALASVSINDTPQAGNGVIGNSDGFANPGERVQLLIRLWNSGSENLQNINGVLRAIDHRITVIDSTANFSTLPPFPVILPGDTVINTSRLLVELHPGFVDGETIPVLLQVTTNDTTANRLFAIPITIGAHRLAVMQSVAIDSLHHPVTIVPGGRYELRVALRNDAGFNGGTALAQLESLSPFVTIVSDSSNYPAFPSSVVVANDTTLPFRIVTEANTIPGSVAVLRMILSNPSIQDTLHIPITIGTRRTSDPSGPDPFGYLAIENTDTAYPEHPEYRWIEIMPQRGGSGIQLPINDWQEGRDTSIVIALPFPVKYYDIWFDSATVCSNGWISLGTSARYYRNRTNIHLPPCGGPRNLIAPFWDDLYFTTSQNHGVYFWHDTTNRQLVITWLGKTLFGEETDINEFQLVLNDTRMWYNTNSPILFQYRRFNNVSSDIMEEICYATIGIADGSLTRGLEATAYNRWTPGFLPIANTDTTSFANRAIKFLSTQDVMNDVSEPTSQNSWLPQTLQLFDVYPNPFNSEIQFRVMLPTNGELQWIIYDAVGRIVYQSSQQTFAPGAYRMSWHGRSSNGLPVSSGIYFLKMQHGSQFTVQKIILLR
ncbi:MAG: C25 family cysteine peptidase [bacterium]|nr:C25 family cysteine peptidase [bacterium]